MLFIALKLKISLQPTECVASKLDCDCIVYFIFLNIKIKIKLL